MTFDDYSLRKSTVPNWCRYEFRKIIILASSICMISCGKTNYPDFSSLEGPNFIGNATVKLDSEAPGNKLPDTSFLSESTNHWGICCAPSGSYNIKRNSPDGVAVDPEVLIAETEDWSTFYTIVLTDINETTLVEPLFGERMHSHPMTEPRETCRVVSGVRDNKLRVGVISHTVYKVLRKGAPPAHRYDYEDGSHCNMVALLMLYGFSETAAQDYMPYVLKERGRENEVIPDFKAIKAAAAKRSAEGTGWPDYPPKMEE